MKVIFAVDAIFPPLTGIGRYALELATRLRLHPEMEDIRYFSMGRWVPQERLALDARTDDTDGPRVSRPLLAAVRKPLSQKVWAVRLFNLVSPHWMHYRLRRLSDFLFHSPNYFVPPFDGRSISTVHDLSVYKYPETHPVARRRMFDLEMGRSLERMDHIITDSESVRSEVIEHFGWPERAISAVHLGVDPRFKPLSPDEILPTLAIHGLSLGGYNLCVSTIEPRKRIESLLSAYEMLPATVRRRYPLVLVGASGWLHQAIDAQIEKGTHQGWLLRLGYVSEDELVALYAGAAAFLYPSIYEGYGLPVVEAMACGVPVLTSDRSSLPEVADGAAWLVDPDDYDAVRDGILKVVEDVHWRNCAIERGLLIAAKRSWERCAEATMNIYRMVAAQ